MNKKEKRQKRVRKIQFDNETIVIPRPREKDVLMIIKSLKDKKDEHHTLKIRKDDISFDMHRTKEKKPKSEKYTTLAKGQLRFPLQKLAEAIRNLVPELKVDVKNPQYQNYTVLIPKSPEKMADFIKKCFKPEKDRLTISFEKGGKEFQKTNEYFNVVPFENVENYTFNRAIVTSPNGDIGFLIKGGKDHYLILLEKMQRLVYEWFNIDFFEGLSKT